MSQGQPDVPEPQDGDASKSENSPPPDKQAPASGIRVEESVPMDISSGPMDISSSKTASPKLTPEVVPAKDGMEFSQDGMEFSQDGDVELEEEVAAVTKIITSVSNKAANVATRRNWRKAVVGTEHVESFLVRAILKTSTPHVRRKALDEQAEKLLAAASDEFLDRALAKRLRTIEAAVLVKMLAGAGRLGFSDGDMVDADETVQPVDAPMRRRASVDGPLRPREQLAPLHIESARPAAQNQTLPSISRDHLTNSPLDQMQPLPPMQYMPPGPPFQQQQVALPTRAIAPANKHSCPDCGQTFAQSAGRKYHMEKKVCHNKTPIFPPGSSKWQCDNCYRIFTTNAGLTYHMKNNVCRDHEMAKATPPNYQSQRPSPLLPSPPGPPFQPGAHFQSAQPGRQSPRLNQSPRLVQSPLVAPSPHITQSPQSRPTHPAPSSHSTPPTQPAHLAPSSQPAAPQPTPAQSAPNTSGPVTLPQGPGVFSRPGPGYEARIGTSYKTGNPSESPPMRQAPYHATPPYPNFSAGVAPAAKNPDVAPTQPPILSTPMGSQETPIRMPNLDPARLAEMNARLANEEIRFKAALERIPESLSAFEREEEINKQKAGHATRKSVIRRDYGVQLRKRKNRSSSSTSSPGSAASSYNNTSQAASSSSFAPINRIASFRAPPSTMMSVMTSNMTPAPTSSAPPDQPQPQPQPQETESPHHKRRRVEYPDSPIQVNSRGMAFSAREYVDKRSVSSEGAPRPNLGDVYGIPGGIQRRKTEGSPAQPVQTQPAQTQHSPSLTQMEVDPDVAAHAQKIRYRNLPRPAAMDMRENRDPRAHHKKTSAQSWEGVPPRTRTPTPVQNQILPAPAAKLPPPALHPHAPSSDGRSVTADARPSLQYPSARRNSTNPATSKSLSPVVHPAKQVERVTISSGSETSSDSSDADADIPARVAPHARRGRTSTSFDSARRTSISMESAGPSVQVSPSLATATIGGRASAPEAKEDNAAAAKPHILSLAETLASKAASALARADDVSGGPSEKTSTGVSTPASDGTAAEAAARIEDENGSAGKGASAAASPARANAEV